MAHSKRSVTNGRWHGRIKYTVPENQTTGYMSYAFAPPMHGTNRLSSFWMSVYSWRSTVPGNAVQCLLFVTQFRGAETYMRQHKRASNTLLLCAVVAWSEFGKLLSHGVHPSHIIQKQRFSLLARSITPFLMVGVMSKALHHDFMDKNARTEQVAAGHGQVLNRLAREKPRLPADLYDVAG